MREVLLRSKEQMSNEPTNTNAYLGVYYWEVGE